MPRPLDPVSIAGLVLSAWLPLGCNPAPGAANPPAEPEPLLGPRLELASPRPAAQPRATARPARLAAVPVAVTPQSTVWINPTEATVTEFKACVSAGGCKPEQVYVQPSSPCNYDAPGRGEHPVNCVDWNGADAYCKWTGGRLCKEEEWFAACKGPQGHDYPYGTTFDASACNVAGQSPAPSDRGTTAVATLASCQGGIPGLYDMVGNVSEWLDACKDDYCHFYGGAYLNNDPVADFASCKRLCAGNKKAFRSATIGFRCCHDAAPKPG